MNVSRLKSLSRSWEKVRRRPIELFADSENASCDKIERNIHNMDVYGNTANCKVNNFK